MAAAQRLLAKQLLLVGRCSLCRQLHTTLDQLPLSTKVAKLPLAHFSSIRDALDRTNGGARSRTFARASVEDRKTVGGRGMRNDRYQGRPQEGGSVTVDENAGMSTGRGARDYDGEGASKSFRGWGSFSKPNTWGTKNKKVWKSKQALSEDDTDTPDDLYPARESVRKGWPSRNSDERWPVADKNGAEGFSSGDGPIRRKAGGRADSMPKAVRSLGDSKMDVRQKGSMGSDGRPKGTGRVSDGSGEVGERAPRAMGGVSRMGREFKDREEETERGESGMVERQPRTGDQFAEVRRRGFGRLDSRGSGSDSESGVQRKVFGVREGSADLGRGVGRRYNEVGSAYADVSERSVRSSDGAPRKKDVIKKAYKRPGSIHTEEDQQPWVRGQTRGEGIPQVYNGLRKQANEDNAQVYSGLRRRVTDETEEGLDGSEEEPMEISAARDLRWGQEIDFKVYQFTPLGMRVIIRGGYEGLVYTEQMEVYGRERIEVGDVMKGYVGKVREDEKVDVSLRPFGLAQYQAGKAYLEEQLIIYGGFIPLTSKSSPEEIAAKLQLTKSAFKKAVGGLMKLGKALETEEGIVLIDESGEVANDRQ